MATIVVDPVSRLEGHLRISLEIDGGKVVLARSSGTSFRGIENIVGGRDPRDAAHITQRICGVCPVPHAVLSCAAFEAAAGVTVNDQARLVRNLVQAANFIESHLLNFYAFTLPDFVSGLPTTRGWTGAKSPAWRPTLMLSRQPLSDHFLASIHIRRACHEIITALAGKMPHPVGIVAGGVTAQIADSTVADLLAIMSRIQAFVDGAYADDVAALCEDFPEYEDIGVAGVAFLSYGSFPQHDGTLLMPRGVLLPGSTTASSLDAAQIAESTASSRYALDNGGHPSVGRTEPALDRTDAYSWIKAPRLAGQPCEAGPLARAVVAGQAVGRGVLARHRTRRTEASQLAAAMTGWLGELAVGESGLPVFPSVPQTGSGEGLGEAPRGSLGHWLKIDGALTSHYGVVTPTTWNASPRDDQGQPGPMETAMQGVSVANAEDPIEVIRIVHSFDPCLQCAVH